MEGYLHHLLRPYACNYAPETRDITLNSNNLQLVKHRSFTPESCGKEMGMPNQAISNIASAVVRSLPLLSCLLVLINAAAQVPVIEWQNTIGGNNVDYPAAIIPTTDGGYIIGGHSASGISGDKTEANWGANDYWVVKLNAFGNIQWQNTIGGNGDDISRAIIQTADGGYLIGGYSSSGVSGDKTQPSQGGADYWVVKLNATGSIQWEQTIGGNNTDMLNTLIQTSDGGFLLGGDSESGISGNKTEANIGAPDYWVVKLDATGNIAWQNTVGGDSEDRLYAVDQTIDGGYILGGYSFSGVSGDKVQASQGGYDYWVLKLDSVGTIQWQNSFGGTHWDKLGHLTTTNDGGFILGGHSMSGISGNKNQPNQGSNDYWIIKLNGFGNMQWQQTYGGDDSDAITSISQTLDGGYIVGGHSRSSASGDKTLPSNGDYDHWLLKLDPSGNIEWQKVIGGSNLDAHRSITQLSDMEYILVGNSNSGLSGDKTEASQGTYDFWVIKLNDTTMLLPITWGDISAEALGRDILVRWNTHSESAIAHFEVQRSPDGMHYSELGIADAKNDPQGAAYNFRDQKPMPGINYYRIKQVGLEGSQSFSSIVHASISRSGPVSVYPNPVRGWLWINTGAFEVLDVSLYNTVGGLVKHTRASNREPLDLRDLVIGVYLVEINTGREIIRQQVVVQ